MKRRNVQIIQDSMRRVARIITFIGLGMALPALTYAEPGCAAPSGPYGFTFTAVQAMPGPTPALVNTHGIGTITVADDGTLTGNQTVNANGFIFRALLTGTITLRPDCSGTLKAVFPDGSAVNLEIVVTARANTIQALGVDNNGPGTSLLMTFSRTRMH